MERKTKLKENKSPKRYLLVAHGVGGRRKVSHSAQLTFDLCGKAGKDYFHYHTLFVRLKLANIKSDTISCFARHKVKFIVRHGLR